MNFKIPQPRKGSKWIGAIQYYYNRLQYYLSLPSSLMIYGIFYQTIVYPKYNMSFYEYILFFFIGALIVVFVDYMKFSPSIIAYSNSIAMEQNPIYEQIAELRRENKELKEMVERINMSKK